MQQQYLFFAWFDTGDSWHDRMNVYDEPKDLKNFMDWVQAKRKEIEKETGRNAIIKDIKFITHTII